jgi:hypothetical protein
MQKITEEAFAALTKTENGRRHPITVAVQGLEIGEILQISPSDWKWKGKTPSILVTRIEKKSRKRFEFYKQVQAPGGWLVKRVK